MLSPSYSQAAFSYSLEGGMEKYLDDDGSDCEDEECRQAIHCPPCKCERQGSRDLVLRLAKEVCSFEVPIWLRSSASKHGGWKLGQTRYSLCSRAPLLCSKVHGAQNGKGWDVFCLCHWAFCHHR
jgi:hypothetical protein